MRSTIIIGSILALVGLASVAQASDRDNVRDLNTTSVHREVSDDVRTERQHRRMHRSRDRHDETTEHRRQPHETHDDTDDRRKHL
jgi:hypothetical protein